MVTLIRNTQESSRIDKLSKSVFKPYTIFFIYMVFNSSKVECTVYFSKVLIKWKFVIFVKNVCIT